MLLGPLAAVQCVPLGGCRPVNRHQTPPSSRTLRSTNSRQYLHALDCIDTQAYHSLPPQQSGRSRSLDRDTASTDAGGQLEGVRCGWRMCDRHTAGVSLMCLSTETIVCSGTYTRLRMLRESDGRCGRRCVDGRAFRISAPREVAVRGVGRCVVAPVRVLLHPANMIAVVRRAQSTRQPTGDCEGSEIPERASPPRCTAARMECMGCVRCEEWYQRSMQPAGRSRFALRGIFGRTFHETTLGGRSRDNLVASDRTRNGRKCLRGWLLSSGGAAQLLEIPADQVFVVPGVALITLIELVATDRG